jgi:uncharacterized protein
VSAGKEPGRLWVQAVKYGAVGVLNTAVTYLVFIALHRLLGIGEYWANAAGYAAGFVNSFAWNKAWTFKGGEFRLYEFLLFALVALAAYGVQLPVFALLRRLDVRGEIAEFIAMVPYTAAGFLGNRYIAFGKGLKMRNKGIEKPVVLVTGASSGIGERIARVLAQRGYPVALAARSIGKLEALAAELAAGSGVKTWAIRSDLSAPGAAAALRKECIERGIEVGALVNNAGVGLFGEAVSQAEGKAAADLRSMLEVNIAALTELSAAFGRDMAARGSGSILNVASMVALMPVPYFAAYAASKAYVRSFSASLRAELRGKGVRVSCLYPGYVKTNFDAASHADNEAYRKMSEMAGMAPEKVALIAARLLESGRANRVAGAVNSIAAALMGLIPKGLIARVTYGYLKRLLSKG